MSQKSSTFVRRTRERESWLTAGSGGDGAPGDGNQALAMAALAQGALEAIPVPEDAEERSRAAAVAFLTDQRLHRTHQEPVRAPWYLRLGRMMRYVFTLGRRR